MSDITDRKTVLRKIPNGLFIVTAWDGKKPAAAVISFLTQTSIEPPMISLGIKENSGLYRAAAISGKMAVHLLRKDQQDVASSFFKIRNHSENDINGYLFILSKNGNPILNDFPYIIEIEVDEIVKKGDHHIFICKVVSTKVSDDCDILAMADTNWHYGG
jgi:flavin reductase (DIM6/NTAB) family NADH-FMN oxidoreductase RutF